MVASATQSLSRIEEIERALDTIPKSGQSLPPDLAEFIGRSQHVRDREERRQRTIFALAVVGLLSVLPFAAYQTYRRVRDQMEAAVRESQINLLQNIGRMPSSRSRKSTTRLTSLKARSASCTRRSRTRPAAAQRERELGRLSYRSASPSSGWQLRRE